MCECASPNDSVSYQGKDKIFLAKNVERKRICFGLENSGNLRSSKRVKRGYSGLGKLTRKAGGFYRNLLTHWQGMCFMLFFCNRGADLHGTFSFFQSCHNGKITLSGR